MPWPLLVFWFALTGGAIGSFLNVVVYRLPCGKSLTSPPSHCPKCNHGIRWYDNVPVLGWILLRGRCRDCKEPISFRYPLIEGVCAATFTIVAFLVLVQDKILANPRFPWEFAPLFEWGPPPALVAGLLVPLMAFLVTGLIEYDKLKVPLSIFVLPVLIVVPMLLITEEGMAAFFLKGMVASLPLAIVSWKLTVPEQRLSWGVSLLLNGFYFGMEWGLLTGFLAFLLNGIVRLRSGKSAATLFLFAVDFAILVFFVFVTCRSMQGSGM